MVIVLMASFDNICRGGFMCFYDWVADNVEMRTSWKTKGTILNMSPALLAGIEFSARAIPMSKPCVHQTSPSELAHVVVYSDAEWAVPAHPPWHSEKA